MTEAIINDGTRYNFSLDMQNLRHALVAYVKGPVGEFVENLRRELHPGLRCSRRISRCCRASAAGDRECGAAGAGGDLRTGGAF